MCSVCKWLCVEKRDLGQTNKTGSRTKQADSRERWPFATGNGKEAGVGNCMLSWWDVYYVDELVGVLGKYICRFPAHKWQLHWIVAGITSATFSITIAFLFLSFFILQFNHGSRIMEFLCFYKYLCYISRKRRLREGRICVRRINVWWIKNLEPRGLTRSGTDHGV